MARLLDLLIIPLRFVICWTYLGLISACFFPVFVVLFPSRYRRILASNIYGQI
eukprot:gene48740-biopygen34074